MHDLSKALNHGYIVDQYECELCIFMTLLVEWQSFYLSSLIGMYVYINKIALTITSKCVVFITVFVHEIISLPETENVILL